MPGEKATGDAAGLVLDDVSFSYRDPDTGDTFRAVDGLDLRLDPGRRVAIVGPSGSGKSTLGKMIPRLFDPDHGRLRVGGTPVDQLDLQVWRRRVGYVGQNVCLFAGTIDDNVRFGLDPAEISADQLDRVVRIARVDLVAADKTGGLDTRVGEGGQKLSGGQKKRIALARALIRRPAVLVIDQLAADLEAELCRAIFEAIRHAYPTMSILHVGHRVPVGFEPDEVFWMEHGRIQPRSSVVDDDRPVSPTPECTSGQPPNP